MRELFIYYRVRPAQAGPALDAARALQADLRQAFPGLRTRLLTRHDEPADRRTWMETYATDPMHFPQGITAEMEAEIAARAESSMSAFIDGARHTEAFVPCAS